MNGDSLEWGTSKPALAAVILASGAKVEEIPEIMDQLRFETVPPTVVGIAEKVAEAVAKHRQSLIEPDYWTVVEASCDRYGGRRIKFVRFDNTGWQDHTGARYVWSALHDPVVVVNPVIKRSIS